MDDEHFRTVLNLAIEAEKNPSVKELKPVIHKSLRKPNKRKYLTTLITQMKDIDIYSPSGIYLGSAGLFTDELGRMDKIASRIIKGLFYHETRHRLPDNFESVAFYENSAFKPFSQKKYGNYCFG